MTEPAWLAAARKYVGVREVPGKANNATIMSWPRRIATKFSSLSWAVQIFTGDVVPWCGLFVAEDPRLENDGQSRERSLRDAARRKSALLCTLFVKLWKFP